MLLAAICDTACIVVTYNALFYGQFHRLPVVTGSVLLLVGSWLSISYLLGKYSLANRQNEKDMAVRQLALASGTAICVGITVILADWLTQANDPRIFRSFILPFLAAVSISSAICQAIIRNSLEKPQSWLVVYAENEASSIERMRLKSWSSHKKINIQLTRDCDAMRLVNEDLTGVALSEQADICDKDLEELLVYRGEGGRVCSLVEWVQERLHRLPPELLSTRRVATSRGFRLQPNTTSWRLKRLGDILMSAFLLIVTSPIILMAALAVYIEDHRSPFFRQVRTGIFGSRITILKIRSMHTAAEEEGAQWSSRNDARVTRVGKILRRMRFDELPQLLNVLKGDMSLIGPRPERPELEEMLEQHIEHYRVRHWIRPGLSGWAQVSYPYGASIEDSRMKMSYDLYYMRNYSLLLDLMVLFKTIKLVASGSGSEPNSDDSK